MLQKPRRKSLRLLDHDYTEAGAYFVTMCTIGRRCLFGHILGTEMHLSDAGRSVEAVWTELPAHHIGLTLDQFVVMPNHVHGILILDESARSPLPEIVRAFKSFSAHRINLRRGTPGASLWQRGYYDHVIRNEADMARVREYVVNNPAQWALDDENPERPPSSKPA